MLSMRIEDKPAIIGWFIFVQNKSTHLSTGAKVRADSIHFVPSWHVIRSNLCYEIGVQIHLERLQNPCNSPLLSLLLVQALHGGEQQDVFYEGEFRTKGAVFKESPALIVL